MKISIYKSLYDKLSYEIDITKAIERIKSGNSKDKVTQLRSEKDENRRKELKMSLPAMTFSGTFKERKDEALIRHSGYVCLDFDHVVNPEMLKAELAKRSYIYAAWVSPSGEGVKALVRICDTTRHDEHYDMLIHELKCDPACRNVSRLCFESYDPDIYVNTKARTYELTTGKKVELTPSDKFDKLLKWLEDRGNAFAKGERNLFIFRLSSACCRVGIDISECENLVLMKFPVEKSFTQREAIQAIKSAYRTNTFNSCEMDGMTVYEKEGGAEIDPAVFLADVQPIDIIYLNDTLPEIMKFLEEGWTEAESTYFPALDVFWKWKRGDLNILTGMGNAGKSTFLYHLCLIKSIKEGVKWCIFSPETYPARNFYIDLAEMYLGCDLSPNNLNRPSMDVIGRALDFIQDHFYYIYPSELSPTPQYLKERFLEMIIKKGVDGCIIDPYNQMDNYTDKGQREDQYISTFLSDLGRFIKQNDVFCVLVNHPRNLVKGKDEDDYPCPNEYNLAGGAMWNNKADNLLVYHRPFNLSNPMSPVCEFHSKKIKRQKEVGVKGMIQMEYDHRKRRFYINGYHPLEQMPRIQPITTKAQEDEQDLF
jgi:hypothetical protein